MKRTQAGSDAARIVRTPRHTRLLLSMAIAAAGIGLTTRYGNAAELLAAGNNSIGQLGDGTTVNRSTFVPVLGMNFGIGSISSGFASLAVKDGALFGWGYSMYGATGNGTGGGGAVTVPQPGVAPLTSGVTSVFTGQVSSMAIKNGALYSFGTNFNGVLGNGTPANSNDPLPKLVIGLESGVTAVSGGQQHALAIKNGALYTWGYAQQGALGNGTSGSSASAPNVNVATAVAGFGSGVTQVAGGSNHSLVVRNNVVYGFGQNLNGAVGNDGTTEPTDPAVRVNTPTAVVGLPGTGTVTDIAAGGSAAGDWSMALVNGAVYAWGANGSGQLGIGSTAQQTRAVAVQGITGTIVDIEAGSNSAYALAADGSLWAWGGNADGRLGLGSAATQFNTPQQLFAPAGYRFSDIGADTIAAHVLIARSALPVYFKGTASGSLTDVANYATTVAGTTAAPIAPVESTDIFFGTANATVANLGTSAGTGMVANSLTFGTGVSATNAVTIGGSGPITLYADKNVYAAGTGILVQSGSAAATINAPLTLGASQSWTNNSAAALTVNGNVTLGTKTLTLAGSGNIAVNGVISGDGALAVTGAGTTALTGANTYTGGTTVNNTAAKVRVTQPARAALLNSAGTNLAAGEISFEYSGASPVGDIRALLATAYLDNFATGTLRSSTATASRGLGYKDDGLAVTVKATLYGDANLDGTVNFNDFLLLQASFGGVNTRFDQGNFNYDNATNFNDFLLLQANFGQSVNGAGFVATAGEVAALTAFANANVPEPAALAVVGSALLVGLRRSRRVSA